MTIIFGFKRNNVAVLCGDTLLSRAAQQTTNVRLPLGPVHSSISGKFEFKLGQKINIVDPAVALAWSGSYDQAFDLVKEIKLHVDRSGPSASEIGQIIVAHADHNLRCIALLAEGDQISYLWSQAETASLRRFENVCCAGGGSTYFKEMIAALDSVDPISEPAIDNAASVVCDGLTFASQSMGRELFTQQNLVERWGGTIELCYRAADAFVKLDKVAFVHFRYDETSPEAGLTWVPRLLLNRYNGPDLECIALQCEPTSDRRLFSISHDDSVVIHPLISHGAVRPTPVRTFEYQWLCTHFSYCRAGQSVWSMSKVDACPNGPGPFRVAINGSTVDACFTNRLGDWMREQIRTYQDGRGHLA
jgi:hypothetical protein